MEGGSAVDIRQQVRTSQVEVQAKFGPDFSHDVYLQSSTKILFNDGGWRISGKGVYGHNIDGMNMCISCCSGILNSAVTVYSKCGLQISINCI